MKSKVSAKMMTALLLTFTIMVIPMVSVPTVSATTLKFNETIYCAINYRTDLPLFWIDPNPHNTHQPQSRDADWCGPLTGDINGMSYFWETDKNFVTAVKGGKGGIEHFFEDFMIVFPDGWIVGHETNGIFDFGVLVGKTSSSKYRAEGRITDASDKYAYLIGSKFFEEGLVYWPTDPATANYFLVGYGRGFIGP
jgi:hypothetical protein